MAPEPPSSSAARVRLRPVVRDDVPTLQSFLDEPEVGRWWPPPPTDEDFPFDEPELVVLAIEVDGRVAGLVQYLGLEPDYRHASIDVFLGGAFHGRGLGPDAVRTVVRHLILDRGRIGRRSIRRWRTRGRSPPTAGSASGTSGSSGSRSATTPPAASATAC